MRETKSSSLYNLFAISHQKGIEKSPDYHTHFHYEIFIFHAGNCKYLIDNKVYDLVPGDIILMDGSKLHKPFVTGDKRSYDRSIVQFSLEWILPVLEFLDAANLLKPFQMNHHSIYRTGDEHLKRLVGLVEDMEKLTMNGPLLEGENELKVKLMELLYSIRQYREEKLISSDDIYENNAYIQQIATYVQEHFNKKIMLEDVAKEINISKSYMVHMFKEQTGQTIMDYVMQYRLRQSIHLFNMYPDWTIKQISSECGFESEAHFSRFFKRHIGLSPSLYRKTYKTRGDKEL
ncbi:AraC family transcriptional regulator [Bacillus sinesaloumensis]|uniref:AraC family transcriptional regulator n=1 Tax=Litchfieldia sinesaloumensis TaxID=1926280 RepID=UPI0009888BF9|nr:AraC family transcriptional regulator [Bacillus sinesaloumensis]